MTDNQNSLFSNMNSGLFKPKTAEESIEETMVNRVDESFKPKTSTEDYRDEIASNEIRLRKNDREMMFKGKRLQQNLKVDWTLSLKDKLTIPLELYEECAKMKVEVSELEGYIILFKSQDNVASQYRGIVGLRKILSFPNNPPIQEAIDGGLVFDFIKYLENSLPEFQFEALWCLTNIASGTSDHTMSVVNKGGIQKIIPLIDSTIQELQEQAIWAIGNLAGDSVKIRDRVIQAKGFEKIMKAFYTAERPSLLKQCTWAISNFCRSKPAPEWDLLKPTIEVLFKAIYKLDNDMEFLVDACWILSYLTENHKKSIKKMLDLQILPKLISLLEYPMVYIQLPVLRIIGNIVAGNALQTQMVLDAGSLNYLSKTIFNEKRSVRKETCWILSNFAAGTQLQIEALISHDFLPILHQVVKNDEPEIQKEAIWAICNLTSTENKIMMEKIINQGILEIICLCLKMTDAKYIAVSLEALGNLLTFGKQYYIVDGKNLIVKKIEEMGMFDLLESLQMHPVEIVYEKTIKILENYFETENQN